MPLCQWPSTGWSGWLTAPATLVRLRAFSMRDLQRRISDCGLWRFCSTYSYRDEVKKACTPHWTHTRCLIPPYTGSEGHHYCKPQEAKVITCYLQSAAFGSCSGQCFLVMKADKGDSPSPGVFLKGLEGKDLTVKHSSLVLKSSSSYFSNSYLISGANLRFVTTQQIQNCGHH